MAIEKIHIKNYKSIVDITIDKPNPFTVFVGPNAAGKSNIFESLEFFSYVKRFGVEEIFSFFDRDSIVNYNFPNREFKIQIKFSDLDTFFISDKEFSNPKTNINNTGKPRQYSYDYNFPPTEIPFFETYFKLFIKNKEKVRIVDKGDQKLSADASNLEKVLKRLLMEPFVKEEFIELVSYLIPELEKIEIVQKELSGGLMLQLFEKYSKRPFPGSLISDGTYNIIALLTSVYQSYFEFSDKRGYFKRQFLCIEEPENGIHPEAIKELVSFFREQCKEKGHYIWLTTHSQSLVSELKPEEIVVVDKIKGETKIKQFQGKDFFNLKMDDAWLSNVLGGGLI